MTHPGKKHLGFVKTTAIGGLIFLLPLIVIGALLGQGIQIVLMVADVLNDWLPVHTAAGWALLVALALGVILICCFLAGMAARRSFAKRFSQTIEKNLIMLFPRYAIFKDQLAGSVGGDSTKPELKPVMVEIFGYSRVAFEADRREDGLVAIYLPGAPDPWSGSVVYLNADQVKPLTLEFSDAAATCERLGRESVHLVG